MKLLWIPLLFLHFGCTAVYFKSKGMIPLSVGSKKNHIKKSEVKGISEFYLYGIIPKTDQTIYIDELLLKKAGMRSAANISIYEFQTFGDMMTTMFSLGFYIPTRYKITAFGPVEVRDESDR